MRTILLITISTIIMMLNLSCTQTLKRKYNQAIKHSFAELDVPPPTLLTIEDISHLPEIVQKYIVYSNAVGREKVYNMKVTLEGGIRSNPDEDFMKLKSVQYNFFEKPSRMFYIKAPKMGIPAYGLHVYKDRKATFKVKLLGLIKIIDVNDPRLDQGERVIWFNDLCLIAPAALIDDRITWKEIDPLSVKATFTNGNIAISAILYFKESGELVNFVSYDRCEIPDNKTFVNNPFSTPVHEYMNHQGRIIIKSGDAVYHRPDGEFVYGQFFMKSIEYNVAPE